MEDVTIKKLPSILFALGQDVQSENGNAAVVLTVLAVALMSGKDGDLCKVVIEDFFNQNIAFYNDLQAKELRKHQKHLSVIK